ncbi:MAG TPA: maleylpyruvate isomerase N-terminal domain-containing protein [Mucilaginibacter sp.]|nr:maleylpyruvate isomerase N-terminal domain-containing protein [Mucilaginibacter sp.]
MIQTAALFPILHQKLIGLLTTLSDEDWHKPTIAKLWTVKDVAAHLLDVNLRTLALCENHSLKPDRDIASYNGLVAYLNHLNNEWVSAAKRISPGVLTELIDITGKKHSEYMASVDPYAEAPYAVAWAGEEQSAMWFHVAREYTEKWHHQQQIRDATGRPGIMTRELFYPCIDTFMYGLPHTYRHTVADEGTIVKISVTTDIGGDWYLKYEGGRWNMSKNNSHDPAATIMMTPEISWKLFTKGISPETAIQGVELIGDLRLARVALNLIAVMA